MQVAKKATNGACDLALVRALTVGCPMPRHQPVYAILWRSVDQPSQQVGENRTDSEDWREEPESNDSGSPVVPIGAAR